MIQKTLGARRPVVGSLVLIVSVVVLPSTVFAESATLAESLPSGALAYAEVARLEQAIELVEHSAMREMLIGTPPYQALENEQGYQQAQALRQIVETQLGMDLWTLGKWLTGERLAVGLYPAPGNDQPAVVGVVRVADRGILAHVRERLEPFLVLAAEQVERTRSLEGTEVLSLDEKAFVALSDDWVVAASNRDLFTKTQELLAGKGGDSLAADESYQAMVRKMGRDHLALAYVNTEAINAAQGGRLVPEKLDNPLVSLIGGGILERAMRSPFAGLSVDLEATGLIVTAAVPGAARKLGEAYQPFFSDPSTPGTPPLPELLGLIGGVTLYRDFAGWYRNREELLEEKVLPGFDQFEAGLANLLPGKDFSGDVLPLIGNNLTFVAAPQDYSHLDGEPGVKLPGFALIVQLDQPQEAADLLQMLFQTFTAILNTQAGQQGRQPWVITSESYQGVQIAYGRYLKKPSGDRLPLVYNFMPASARVGDRFVIASSVGTCRQLVDQLQKPPTSDGPNRNEAIELYAEPVAALLEANHEFYEAQRVQAGRSQKEAEAEVATLLEIVRYFDSLTLSTRVESEGLRMTLEVRWK